MIVFNTTMDCTFKNSEDGKFYASFYCTTIFKVEGEKTTRDKEIFLKASIKRLENKKTDHLQITIITTKEHLISHQEH